MRKLILTGMAVAMLAVPAAASASVSPLTTASAMSARATCRPRSAGTTPRSTRAPASLKFTASAEKVTADYKMSCFNGSTGASSAVGHRDHLQPGTTTVTATPIYNAGNGKQITGFNLTGQTSGFTATGGATLRDSACPEGSFMFMNLGQGDLFGKTQITGGLKVNGIDLPNTPVAVAPVA